MKIHYLIAQQAEGTMEQLAPPAQLPPIPVTLEEVLGTLAALSFTVETIAHLMGKERELLPQAEQARSIIAALQTKQVLP